MKIKVCGLKYPENISGILESEPDLIGFIFYDRSLRYIGEEIEAQFVIDAVKDVRTVGVFVNEVIDQVLVMYNKYGLDYVQLHGDESPEYCAQLRRRGVATIKAFQLGLKFDFRSVLLYSPHVDLFLFDTPGSQRGGTGRKFDWSLLSDYSGDIPFILSGGISSEDVEAILDVSHPHLHGIDINSRFEISPGVKDLKLVSEFIKNIRHAVHS